MDNLKERRKSEIIESAIIVFGTKGFHKGKMEDVAQGAGLGKGTVYEYFDSKKDLLNQVVIYLLSSYLELVEEIVLRDEGVKDKVTLLMDSSQDFLLENSNIIKETFFQSKDVSRDCQEEIERLHLKIFELILDLIEQGIKSEDIKDDIDKRTVGFMLLNTIIGMNNSSSLCRGRYELSSKAIVELLFNGIS